MKEWIQSYMMTAANMIIIMIILYIPVKLIFKFNKNEFTLKKYYYLSLLFFVIGEIYKKMVG